MTHIRNVNITLMIIAIALCAAPVSAQEGGRDRGFYIGARLAGTGLAVDDNGESGFVIEEGGGGLQLFTGYSFNDVFSLEMDIVGASHETNVPAIEVSAGGLQIFAHYRFRPGHNFRPYVKGGLGGFGVRVFNNDSEVRIEGGGVPVGGGFDYFFNSHFSLGLDFTYNIIQYDKVAVDIGGATVGFDLDQDGAMSSLGLSFTGYF